MVGSWRSWTGAALGAALVLSATGMTMAHGAAVRRPASGKDVSWISPNGPVSGGRYSPLSQINAANVGKVGVAWKFKTETPGSESYPVIDGSTVYWTTTFGNVYSVNAVTGKENWEWVAPTEKPGSFFAHGAPNRGVAVGGGRVYVLTPNAALYAINQATGKSIYHVQLGNYVYLSETTAPILSDGVLYIGSSGSESGQRGFFEARKASNGALIWKTYTVPNRAAKGTWLYGHHGGGDVWGISSVDQQLGMVFIGVGNPSPDYYGVKRPGPNPYTDSIMALSIKTGKMVWDYQETPHDLWDYDQAAGPTVFPTGAGMVVGAPSKGGVWYEVSAKTGQLMTAPEAFVTINHTDPVPNGPPLTFWPGSNDGAEWGSAAYDPQTGSAYVEGINGPGQLKAAKVPYHYGLDMGTDILPPPKGVPTTGTLTSFNVDAGAQVWQDKFPTGLVGGATATGGHLLLVQISGAGRLDAINPTNGKVLASWNLGERIDAGVSVAMVNGKEYIIVSLGGSGPQYGGPLSTGTAELVALALK